MDNTAQECVGSNIPAIPTTNDAFRLFMNGEEALSHASFNGFKIDKPYLQSQKSIIIDECNKLRDEIFESTDIGRMWRSRYGTKADLDSDTQIKMVLDKDAHFDKFRITDKGNISVDKNVIAKLPYDFSGKMLKREQLRVLWTSLIKSVLQESDADGFIHPNFNLHTVRTFRSSCDEPNLQNMPKHNERQKKILRTGFIPRAPGRQIVEIDLRANEVSCGCSIHHDAQMMSYLSQGEKANMHTDVEKHCYRLSDKEITKELRNSVKGRFVFSSFYGAGAESIARNIWEFITDENPKTGTGVPIRDHMETFGVIDYDSMLLHIEKEYNWFWHELFSGYGKWKEEIWTTYKNQGYLDLPTGFRVVAEMRKTQAMNVIPQGAAFHVLLATFIGLVKRMEYYKLESVVIGQIHDSIVLDVVPQELQMIYNLYLDSQAEVLRRWKWLCFPIVAEADVSKIDGNWADMDEQGPIHKIA